MSYTAFTSTKRLATGDLAQIATHAQAALQQDPCAQILIFDDATGAQVDIDFRGTPELQPESEPRRAGRPKLGVIPREVTLLPRHWDWLATQPGGASVALRKLVEQARKTNQDADRRRQGTEATYRFLSAMAGNEPGFEEAIRALFAGNRQRFDETTEPWPADVRDYARTLTAAAFDTP